MSSFDWNLRVYWEDTDAGGVVFYANYLKFFERARTEWLRSLGIEQQTLADVSGVVFVVRSTSVEYNAPARLDDQLVIRTDIERVGPASVQFAQEAWRDDVLLATGHAYEDAPQQFPAVAEDITDEVVEPPEVGDRGPARRGAGGPARPRRPKGAAHRRARRATSSACPR